MSIDFESLGFTEEELQSKVIEKLCDQVMHGLRFDEEGDNYEDTTFAKRLYAATRKHIDDSIDAIAEKHVLPSVESHIEKTVLIATNKWGEATGKSLTFTEYLVARAEKWMAEEVDHHGKPKDKRSSYSWKGKQPRIAHMIHDHLHVRIEKAMKSALEIANNAIVGGIQETTKRKLEEISQNLQATIKTERGK